MWWPVMVILTRVNVGGVSNSVAGPLYRFTQFPQKRGSVTIQGANEPERKMPQNASKYINKIWPEFWDI